MAASPGGRGSGVPASIRDSSTTRSSPSTAATRCRRDLAVVALGHHDLGVGERRDLRQVGDDEHLGVGPGERGERPADRERRLAADAGVDLVEHQRARPGRAAGASSSTSRRASIARASSPPDATWRAARAARRVGGEQEGHVVAGRGLTDRHLRPGLRHGQVARWASTAAASGAAAPARPRRTTAAAAATSSSADRPLGVEDGRRAARGRAARPAAPSPRPRTRSRRRGCRRTCAAGRAAAGGARAPRARRSGSSSIRSPVARTSAARSATSASDAAQAGLGVGERAPAGERRRPPRRARRRRRRRRRAARSRPRRPPGGRRRRRAGPPRPPRRRSSSGSSSPAAVELVDLEAQQVDLAGPGPLVAAELRRARRRSRPTAAAPRVERARGRSPPNRSSAPRWVAVPSSDWWACWPCRSTRRAPRSASADAGARRPST